MNNTRRVQFSQFNVRNGSSTFRYDNGGFYPGGNRMSSEMVGEGEGLGYNLNIGWNGVCHLLSISVFQL